MTAFQLMFNLYSAVHVHCELWQSNHWFCTNDKIISPLVILQYLVNNGRNNKCVSLWWSSWPSAVMTWVTQLSHCPNNCQSLANCPALFKSSLYQRMPRSHWMPFQYEIPITVQHILRCRPPARPLYRLMEKQKQQQLSWNGSHDGLWPQATEFSKST